MNIDEAIEIKEDTLYKRKLHHQDKIDEADRLSIEALKYIKSQSYPLYQPMRILLPGETKE